MSQKEYFPGANTPDGFYSCYSHILKPYESKRRVILKGGAGTGKSSLMKKVASFASKNGFSTEILHCSSDPESLDGVCIREAGFLIVDGTSPHIIDPNFPGCTDEIVNLGDFWDEASLIPHSMSIKKLSSDIANEFAKSYQYMKAAQCIDNSIKMQMKYDADIIPETLHHTKKELGISNLCFDGKSRPAFLSAYTHCEKTSYAPKLANEAKCVIQVNPDRGGGWEEYMQKLSVMLNMSGKSVRVFWDCMNPGITPEHIYIENEDIFITTESLRNADVNVDMIIDFNAYEQKISDKTSVQSDILLFDDLIKKAVEHLKTAKKLHDDLEKYYIPCMNFDKAEELYKKIINKIR